MSRALTIAEQIRARLEAWPGLNGIACIIDRQLNILSQVAQTIEKSRGSCVTIFYEGFRNHDPNTSGPLVIYRFTVRLYALAIANQEGIPDMIFADDASEELCKALHHWVPAANFHHYGECRVLGCDPEQDNNFLIYAHDVEVWSQI